MGKGFGPGDGDSPHVEKPPGGLIPSGVSGRYQVYVLIYISANIL